MKTGRPEYYIPSLTTVSRDVCKVFAQSQQQIAAMLRVTTLRRMHGHCQTIVLLLP